MSWFICAAYFECIVVGQVGFNNVDVGASIELCILRNPVDSCRLVAHDTDNGVAMVAGKLAGELVLLQTN